MKRLIYLIILGIACTMTGCMHNGGDIGHLFGQWRLEYIDSEHGTQPCDTVFFSFQSDVFQVRKIIYNSYDYTGFTGLYEHQDGHIKFKFYHHNSQDVTTPEQEARMLKDLESLHIDTATPLMGVTELTRKKMVLEYKDYRYHFVKLN